ncbi:hypothetical protein NL676_021272 [Syzygium grande]|nr:hypothetical protein NL676_021272 [Syzygium grande]
MNQAPKPRPTSWTENQSQALESAPVPSDLHPFKLKLIKAFKPSGRYRNEALLDSTLDDPDMFRYSKKRRDWNTFGQYLRNHRPPLSLSRCSGAHVLEFLRYLDQFGKTKVHTQLCPFFGHPSPPAPCPCPLRQAWGSLDALVGRLRAAFEENGGKPEANPFGARAVRLYLREVRDSQAKARGDQLREEEEKEAAPSPHDRGSRSG